MNVKKDRQILKQGVFLFSLLTVILIISCSGLGGHAPVKKTAALNIQSAGIEEKKSISVKYRLYQNYPNPFNPRTTIEFSIPKLDYVTLTIYNIFGQELISLVSDKLSPGNHKYFWDASGYASGIYYYKIDAGSFVQTKKLLLIK